MSRLIYFFVLCLNAQGSERHRKQTESLGPKISEAQTVLFLLQRHQFMRARAPTARTAEEPPDCTSHTGNREWLIVTARWIWARGGGKVESVAKKIREQNGERSRWWMSWSIRAQDVHTWRQKNNTGEKQWEEGRRRERGGKGKIEKSGQKHRNTRLEGH